MTALAIPLGLAIGMALGMLGGGGAVLAVPVLVYVLGQDPHSATTSSLVVVSLAALAAGASQARQGQICWRHAAGFAVPAIAGVAVGTLANQAVDGRLLLISFAPVMLLAAWATWRKAGEDRPAPADEQACPPVRLRRDGGAGFGVGLLTGFFGVGGGFVIVPTLAIALDLPLRYAIATSLVVVVAVSAVGLVSHLLAGGALDPAVTAALAGSCVVGALAGVPLARRVPQAVLARSFAVLVAVVAVYLVVASVLLDTAPSG